MDCVVLDSKPKNQYGDTPEEYPFPRRYLDVFAPLSKGQPLFALIYEPRGQDRSERGRMAYVGWATIKSAPEPIPGHPRGWYRVRYDTAYHPFDHIVPRRIAGEPIESRLRGGQEHQIGNAVRQLPEAEAQLILEGAYGGRFAPELPYPELALHVAAAPTAAREHVERLVRTIERDAAFRDGVIGAYDGRCAVSGFEAGSKLPRRTHGLLDAAHIQPVSQSGPDSVWNGLSLTPTLHRLFDAGLFTVERGSGELVVVTSKHLDDAMITSPNGRWRLDLRSGIRLRVPANAVDAPSDAMLRYHQGHVFQP
jgi:putative restriction endonuclease